MKDKIIGVISLIIGILLLVGLCFDTMTKVKNFFKEDEASSVIYKNYENCIIINN